MNTVREPFFFYISINDDVTSLFGKQQTWRWTASGKIGNLRDLLVWWLGKKHIPQMVVSLMVMNPMKESVKKKRQLNKHKLCEVTSFGEYLKQTPVT